MKNTSDNNSAVYIPVGLMCGCASGTAIGLFLGAIISDANLGLWMLYGCSGGCSLGLLIGVLLCVMHKSNNR